MTFDPETEDVVDAMGTLANYIREHMPEPHQNETFALLKVLVDALGALYIAGAKNPDTTAIYRSIVSAVETRGMDASELTPPKE